MGSATTTSGRRSAPGPSPRCVSSLDGQRGRGWAGRARAVRGSSSTRSPPMTFAYWERCSDEPEDLAERGPILASLLVGSPEVAQISTSAPLSGRISAPRRRRWTGAPQLGRRTLSSRVAAAQPARVRQQTKGRQRAAVPHVRGSRLLAVPGRPLSALRSAHPRRLLPHPRAPPRRALERRTITVGADPRRALRPRRDLL